MFTGRKLALTLAFTVLVVVAFGVSCKGFFVKPTLASITINPTAPSVQLGQSTTLQAYGLDNESPPVGSNLTSGVSWSSATPTVAAITGACATGTCGSVTIQGVTVGTSTITASAQSVTNTATATVYITISSLSISPASQSMAATATTPAPFIVKANGSTDVSSGATLNVYLNGTLQTTITCSYNASAAAGAGQYCSSVGATVGNGYQVVATYTGSNLTATATLDIT